MSELLLAEMRGAVGDAIVIAQTVQGMLRTEEEAFRQALERHGWQGRFGAYVEDLEQLIECLHQRDDELAQLSLVLAFSRSSHQFVIEGRHS